MGYEIFKRMQRLQGGTEAVAEELPTPPDQPPDRGDKLRRYLFDQVRQGVLPDDALAEMRRDPTSLRSILGYGEAAMAAGTLFSGGRGKSVSGFRGEPKGPSPAGHAHGLGTYYGLDEGGAQRFSREGTVKQTELNPENPFVVNSDAELSSIRERAGVNPDPRMLLSMKEAARFTDYLQNLGHDSFVTNYVEAPGGKQILMLP